MKRYIKSSKSIAFVYTDIMEEFAYVIVNDAEDAERVTESNQRRTDRPID